VERARAWWGQVGAGLASRLGSVGSRGSAALSACGDGHARRQRVCVAARAAVEPCPSSSSRLLRVIACYVRRNWCRGQRANSIIRAHQDRTELMPALDSNCSFTAAVADTHDCNLIPHRSKHSNCIYEVKMIGRRIDAHNIEPDISTRIV